MAIDSKHNDKISNIVNTDDKMDNVSGSEDVVKRASKSDHEVAASSPDRTSIKQEYKVKPQVQISFHDLPMKPLATPNLPILHRC